MMSIFAKACIGGQFVSFVGLLIFVQFRDLGVSVELPGLSILPGQDAVSSVVSLGLASSFCPGTPHLALSQKRKELPAPPSRLVLASSSSLPCCPQIALGSVCSDFDFCLPNPAGVSCPG